MQILLNVLSNAVKFTPADGRITVSTAVIAHDLGAITIRDTGLGMSSEELALVFEPYVQFDNSLSREHKGTGLGMPISREMARGDGRRSRRDERAGRRLDVHADVAAREADHPA